MRWPPLVRSSVCWYGTGVEPSRCSLHRILCRPLLTEISRATRYRRDKPPVEGPPKPRPTPPNALTEDERAEVLAVLRSAKYQDLAVAQVWAICVMSARPVTAGANDHQHRP